jgi:hypothetical protein
VIGIGPIDGPPVWAYVDAMAHEVDGLTLRYTSRTSWKAENDSRRSNARGCPRHLDKGRRGSPPDLFQEIWFRNQSELEQYRLSTAPFLVAVAIAKDYNTIREFAAFRQVLEVQSTRKQSGNHSVETR